MKSVHYYLTLFLTILLASAYSQGNKVNYDRDTKWNFGINAGATWAEKELNFVNSPGFSGGLTLGRSIYEKEGKLLSFDLRGRVLWGQTEGWSSLPYTDTVLVQNAGGLRYENYRLVYTEGALELVVNAHRLREQTGVLLYGFGGVGWVSHSVKHNYKDGNVFYDYSTVDSTAGKEMIAEQLSSSFNDLDWETDNAFFSGRQTKVMPSLGIGLGYQISPRFSIGVEHKVTFALSDNNLDGHLDGRNDRYHYTNVNLRWNLFRGNSNGGSSYDPDGRPINNNNSFGRPSNTGGGNSPNSTNTVQTKNPRVNVTTPSVNYATTSTVGYTVNAEIRYVDKREDVVFKHNGRIINNFFFNASTNKFSCNVNLYQGSNTFEVTGINNIGADSDSKTINYAERCDEPIITFLNPSSNGLTINNQNLNIEARITNVVSRNDIQLLFNGVQINNFTYSNNVLRANFTAVSGNNNVGILARNNCGEKSISRSVNYTKTPEPTNNFPPVVTFSNPITSPFTVNSAQYNISANVKNVANASNIQFKVNGIRSNLFNFNALTKVLTATINLQDGNNFVEVIGTNNFGSDTKSILLRRKVLEQGFKPVVSITYPSADPFRVSTNTSVVNGTVKNVTSSNQISVSVNGVSITNFNYNSGTSKISLTANLNVGTNIIKIKGTNNYGSNEKQITIVYKKKAVLSPPVVQFTSPATSPKTVLVPTVKIVAKVLNVTSASQIQITRNGNPISVFNFDSGTKVLTFNTRLVNADNNFTITATNISGQDSKSTTVVLKREVLTAPPIVTILIPSINPYTTEASSETITAKVDNVSNKSQIVVNDNGQSVSNFTFDNTTKLVTYTARLKAGVSTITISGTNNSGSDLKIQKIERKRPCETPVLSYQIPNVSPHNHVGRNGNMAFTFSSRNVTNPRSVTVKLNGSVIPSNLESINGNIYGTAPLKEGPNKLIVSVENKCGNTTKTIDVLYKKPMSKLDPPIVTIKTPSSFPHTTTSAFVTITGKVINVSSQNSIQVSLDGFSIPFAYNTSTKLLSIKVSLSEGSHKVKITARNNNGVDTETFDLVRLGGTVPKVVFTNLGKNNSYNNPTISPGITYQVRGRVKGFNSATVNAYVNGSRVSNFNYNTRTGEFVIPIRFSTQGQGTQRRAKVEVKATNSFGQSEKKGYLVYTVQSINTDPSGGGSRPNVVKKPVQKKPVYKPKPSKVISKPVAKPKPKVVPQKNEPQKQVSKMPNTSVVKKPVNKNIKDMNSLKEGLKTKP